MNYKKVVYLALLFNTIVLSAQVPAPFNELVAILPEDMHGWFRPENRRHLEQFIRKIRPKKIVEVGTWLDLSAIFMAKFLNSDSKLYCIDPWLPYKEMEAFPEGLVRIKTAYEQFLSNCIHHNVTDRIIPMRMISMQALEHFSSDLDLIYIDGSHAEQDVYNDIIGWWPELSSKGVMCGDDVGWPTVYSGLLKAAAKLSVKVMVDGNFWWLEE